MLYMAIPRGVTFFGRKANLPQARNATLTTFIFYSPFVTSVISGIFNMWLFFSGLVIKNCAKIKYFFIWISEYLHILLHREFCCDWRLSHPLWTYWCMYVLADWTVATFVLQVKIPHLQRTLLEFLKNGLLTVVITVSPLTKKYVHMHISVLYLCIHVKFKDAYN